jgi:hypothetical protein
MKELTLDKNPMNVSNVGNLTLNLLTFKHIEELTHK